MQSPELIDGRYQILGGLERGKLGQTYLAKDTYRFNEPCVVQESDASVEDNGEQFKQVAHILYQLHHPQIPSFRSLFAAQKESPTRWYLVREYIEGQTYRYHLNQKQGAILTEIEAIAFLQQILPVVQYLHKQGISYGKMAPQTLLLRDKDRLPILIDFSYAKPITTTTEPSKFETSQEKPAHGELIGSDSVSSHADLYGLAVTVLELLLPKASPDLLLSTILKGNWQKDLNLSPQFSQVLAKMLSQDRSDHFESAQDVIEALTLLALPPMSESSDTQITIAVPASQSPIVDLSETNPTMSSLSSNNRPFMLGCLGKTILVLILILGSGTVGWFAGKVWLSRMVPSANSSEQEKKPLFPFQQDNSVPKATPSTAVISEEELKRRANLQARRLDLGIDKQFFTTLVNQVFLSRHPERKGKLITDIPEDTEWREKWDEMGVEVLDKLSFLSQEARQQLGSYNQVQRDRIKQQINQFHLSSRALYDLADATFFDSFPEVENQTFIEEPIGQVWQAIVFDKLKMIETGGEIYGKLNFSPTESLTSVKGNLKPGEGRAYVVSLEAAQNMKIELQSDHNVLFSIYSPTGKNNLLEDSQLHTWTGSLPESGFYELTIVSKAKNAIDYRLNLQNNR